MTAIYSFSVRKTNNCPPCLQPHFWFLCASFGLADTCCLDNPFMSGRPGVQSGGESQPKYATILSFSGVQLFYGRALCFLKLNSTTGCSYLLLRQVVSTICCVCDISLDPFRNRHASPQRQVSTSRTHSILLRLFNLQQVAPSSNQSGGLPRATSHMQIRS